MENKKKHTNRIVVSCYKKWTVLLQTHQNLFPFLIHAQTQAKRYLKISMCVISLSQPKCGAQRKVCGRHFHNSFIDSGRQNIRERPWVHRDLLESSNSWNENDSLTYCSRRVKLNGRHWWLRRACATWHQPKCKGTLPCEDGECRSGNAVWSHSDGHCFPVPGTFIEKSHRGYIKGKVQQWLR